MKKMLSHLKFGLTLAWRCKVRAAVLLVILFLGSPKPVKSQFLDPCCAIIAAGLNTIGNTLNKVIGSGLNRIFSIEQDISNFERSTVWPQALINQARDLVTRIRQISGQTEMLMRIPVDSATLPPAQQFEHTLLSGDPNQIAQASSQYTTFYGSVPEAASASPQTRDIVDMSDATAQAAMKRAIEIDALADLEIEAAGQISQSIATAAPGSAPILEAEADAWLVRANAYTQAATADLMRVRAIGLADASAEVKNGARNTAAIRQQIYNLLKRQ